MDGTKRGAIVTARHAGERGTVRVNHCPGLRVSTYRKLRSKPLRSCLHETTQRGSLVLSGLGHLGGAKARDSRDAQCHAPDQVVRTVVC